MKKLILLLAVFAFGTHSALAQFEIIPKIGGTYAYFNEDLDDEELDGRIGFQAGIDFRIGDRVYIEPGAHYYNAQNRISVNVENGDVETDVEEADFSIQALRVPLHVGFKVLKNENYNLRLYGGGSAFLLFNRDKQLEEFDELDLEETLWSANAGIGMDFGRLITLDLTHNWGLSNIFTETDDFTNRKNIVILSLGVRI